MQLTMITIPQGIIIIVNTILYSLTWFKIRQQQPQLKSQIGYERRVTKRAHKAAKNMILLVVTFLIQWCPVSVYGLWMALNNSLAPLELLESGIVSANIGGLLNGIVFLILRFQQKNVRRSSVYTQSSDFSRYSRNSALLRYQDVVFRKDSKSSMVAIMGARTSTASLFELKKGKSTESGLNVVSRSRASTLDEVLLSASAPPSITPIST